MVGFFFVNTIMDIQKCLKIGKLLKTRDFFFSLKKFIIPRS